MRWMLCASMERSGMPARLVSVFAVSTALLLPGSLADTSAASIRAASYYGSIKASFSRKLLHPHPEDPGAQPSSRYMKIHAPSTPM